MINDVKRKIKRLSKTKRVLIVLAAAVLVFILLVALSFVPPSRYEPPEPRQTNEISRYLTHGLGPAFNNDLQRGKAFDLIIGEEGLNDIITNNIVHNDVMVKNFGMQWPDGLNFDDFQDPTVAFVSKKILIMGKVEWKGLGFVATVALKPYIKSDGNLVVKISDAKIGKLRIPFGQAVLTKKALVWADTSEAKDELKLLLDGTGIEPVIPFYVVKLRIIDITVSDRQLVIRIAPENS